MGRRFGRRVPDKEDEFEGVSIFEHEGSRASLDEAIEEAMAAARDEGGYTEADRVLFDLTIQVALRDHNQNVKVYSAKAKNSGQTVGEEI